MDETPYIFRPQGDVLAPTHQQGKAHSMPHLVHELQIRGLFHEVHKVPWQSNQNFIDLPAHVLHEMDVDG